ncbi:1-acyl-sn-glycerol-3-phosphate acyltransferase [Falsiroseomonas sp.]|uniref:lysophospholipid acyltransferase family protein n=1 Tax=Falsiroseomonas sp. TaxID=2870721 RepID=UPI00271A2B96|nr:lysophospholipid acyltransferase family protein [Falsiroseomonas sp.]MDO9500087.1 lysophospholipid acyltransferase family protein [Falsiroseomonas sp.]MDP3415018.1 lysophospholipid acyltransferase family protein [Falsiroseomonas sp.]
MIWLRSLVFNLLFFGITAVVGIIAIPTLLLPSGAALRVTRLWAQLVILALRISVGVRVEVRGWENLPPGGVVIAAKHQSAFDTIIWLSLLEKPAYVMKKELLAIPVYGWHARNAGMIPVDREGGGPALRGMLRAATAAVAAGAQVVIFPEGTRTPVGQRVAYQPGVVAIAAGTGAPVVPVATDSGRVWGRRHFLKRPGVIRIAILPPLPAGLNRARMLESLQSQIEETTDRLMAEPQFG